MTGLRRHDFDRFAKCVHCGVQAVGPCASCHDPLCGDCCIIQPGASKPWAVCKNCAANPADSGRPASRWDMWRGTVGFLAMVLGGLLVAVLVLQECAR